MLFSTFSNRWYQPEDTRMEYQLFLKGLLLLGLFHSATSKPPHIVFILADDLGKIYGVINIRTKRGLVENPQKSMFQTVFNILTLTSDQWLIVLIYFSRPPLPTADSSRAFVIYWRKGVLTACLSLPRKSVVN